MMPFSVNRLNEADPGGPVLECAQSIPGGPRKTGAAVTPKPPQMPIRCCNVTIYSTVWLPKPEQSIVPLSARSIYQPAPPTFVASEAVFDGAFRHVPVLNPGIGAASHAAGEGSA